MLTAVQKNSSHVAVVVEERPRAGEEHTHAACRDFDQLHPPGVGMTFSERVGFAAAVEVATTFATAMCFGEQSIRRLGWRRGNRSTQRDQQVVGQTVQKYPKTIGHVTVIAQPVGTEFTLQFLVAIFAFSAFGVLLVNALRQHAGTRTIGALQVDRALDDDPPRRRPRAGPVVKAREELLGSPDRSNCSRAYCRSSSLSRFRTLFMPIPTENSTSRRSHSSCTHGFG